jgi:hypothetical protein
MNLLKKCVANNHLCTSRHKGRHSFRPVEQADRANSSEIKSDEPWAGRLTFVEDFSQEHSLPGPHIALIGISGSF